MYYKINRHDGSVQYATKYKDNYFLYGSGFGYSKLDCISIEEVEEIPTEYKSGYVYFDDGVCFRAIVDQNNRWNGWYMPWIHESEIDRFFEICSYEDFRMTKEGDNVTIINDDEQEVVSPTEILGEKWYYLGNQGLCFDFVEVEQKFHTWMMGEYYVFRKGKYITEIVYQQNGNWTAWGGLRVENIEEFIEQLQMGVGIDEGWSEYPFETKEKAFECIIKN